MACFHPITGYRAKNGTVTFKRSGGWVDRPISVACGQCSGCRLERSRQWAVRCMHEAQTHDHNCFVTLTYDEEHCPADHSVDIRHFQNFCKKLRRDVGKFRYFHCGEYGDQTSRPHYHAAIFGLDFLSDRKLTAHNKQGDALYSSERLDEAWGQGSCIIGDLTFESAQYVAKYVIKKQTGPSKKTYYDIVDPDTGEVHERKPPYATMSRRPGIGAKWIERFHADVYPSDEVIVNGKKCRPPKFYDAWLEANHPSVLRRLKAQRTQKALDNAEENTADRRHTKETVLESLLKKNSRDQSP